MSDMEKIHNFLNKHEWHIDVKHEYINTNIFIEQESYVCVCGARKAISLKVNGEYVINTDEEITSGTISI
jgi:hypothetical protein